VGEKVQHKTVHLAIKFRAPVGYAGLARKSTMWQKHADESEELRDVEAP